MRKSIIALALITVLTIPGILTGIYALELPSSAPRSPPVYSENYMFSNPNILGIDLLAAQMDEITLDGVMLQDSLPPYYGDFYYEDFESGFPWSKEEVHFTITKYGEIPSIFVGEEHISPTDQVQGWMLEANFWQAGCTPEKARLPTPPPGCLDPWYKRYAYATYADDLGNTGHRSSILGSWDPYYQTTPGVLGQYVGMDIAVDAFRLLVDTPRVAIVKTDMTLNWLGPTNVLNRGEFRLNLTFMFFKDKKYLIEYKNLDVTLPNEIGFVDVQLMQVAKFEPDSTSRMVGGAPAYRFYDASFYQNAPRQSDEIWGDYDGDTDYDPYEFGSQYYPGIYSFAEVEVDERYFSPPQPNRGDAIWHTAYAAFYPSASTWTLDADDLVNYVYQDDMYVGWPGASNQDPYLGYDYKCRIEYGEIDVEEKNPYWDMYAIPGYDTYNGYDDCFHVDQQKVLLLGAWDATLEKFTNVHFTTVWGAAEHWWSQYEPSWTPEMWDPYMGDFTSSLFETVWAMREIFSPLYTLNRVGDFFTEGPIDEPWYLRTWWPFVGVQGTGPRDFDGWPYWGGQLTDWDYPPHDVASNNALFVIGDSLPHTGTDPDQTGTWGAATRDNIAGIYIAQGVGSFPSMSGVNYPPYRAALDTEASVWPESTGISDPVPPFDATSINRWYYEDCNMWNPEIPLYYVIGCEQPVKISSLIDPLYWYDNMYGPISLSDKTAVWHIISTGGPYVNRVTQYFNDFSYVQLVRADDLLSYDPLALSCSDPDTCYVYYVPASKHIYYDWKGIPYDDIGDMDQDGHGDDHFFATVNIVMDHNITREYVDPDTGPLYEMIDPMEGTFPWAGMTAYGLGGLATEITGSWIAHTFPAWWQLNTMYTNDYYADLFFPAGFPGVTGVVLEYVDLQQDGHIDLVRLVEVVGSVATDWTLVPEINYLNPYEMLP